MKILSRTASCRTGRRRRLILGGFALIGASLVVLAIVMILHPPYRPPAFEQEALAGTPSDLPENLSYQIVEIEQDFSIGLCATLWRQEDGSVDLYFTNPVTNEALLLLRVEDSEGNLLGRSGLLRPGEYLQKMPLTGPLRFGSWPIRPTPITARGQSN